MVPVLDRDEVKVAIAVEVGDCHAVQSVAAAYCFNQLEVTSAVVEACCDELLLPVRDDEVSVPVVVGVADAVECDVGAGLNPVVMREVALRL